MIQKEKIEKSRTIDVLESFVRLFCFGGYDVVVRLFGFWVLAYVCFWFCAEADFGSGDR